MNNEKSQKASIKSKNMMYAQQIKHLPAQTKDNLVGLIESKLHPTKYAVIIHDKDIDENGKPEEPGIHAMLSFANARSINNVAKLLGDKPQYMEAWKGDSNNGYAYLVHATKDAKNKYQYDPSEVTANFDYPALLETIGAEVAQAKAERGVNVKVLLDGLYSGTITKEEVEQRLTGSQYGRYRRQIEDIWAKRLQDLAADWRKEMAEQGKAKRTIWIYGPPETGKSSFAKEYAEKAGQPYYMTGSSRDIFQGYAGEHTIILDELRPNDLPYHDLLRITDPYGMDVMAPSRYSDKALSADLIIVTSPYNPFDFHCETFGGQNSRRRYLDNVGQLIRRLSLIIKMDPYSIVVMNYLPRQEDFVPLPATVRDNPYSAFNRPQPKTSTEDLYNSMFDTPIQQRGEADG